jgi:hypothetical protein
VFLIDEEPEEFRVPFHGGFLIQRFWLNGRVYPIGANYLSGMVWARDTDMEGDPSFDSFGESFRIPGWDTEYHVTPGINVNVMSFLVTNDISNIPATNWEFHMRDGNRFTSISTWEFDEDWNMVNLTEIEVDITLISGFNFNSIALTPSMVAEFLETGVIQVTVLETTGELDEWGNPESVSATRNVEIPGLRELILAAR